MRRNVSKEEKLKDEPAITVLDLCGYPFINPSVHQSSLIPFSSSHFDLFSHPGPSPWHSPLLQSDTSSQLPRTILYQMEVEMYEWYLPINQRREAPVACNNTVPALCTSDNIQYEGCVFERWRH